MVPPTEDGACRGRLDVGYNHSRNWAFREERQGVWEESGFRPNYASLVEVEAQ